MIKQLLLLSILHIDNRFTEFHPCYTCISKIDDISMLGYLYVPLAEDEMTPRSGLQFYFFKSFLLTISLT